MKVVACRRGKQQQLVVRLAIAGAIAAASAIAVMGASFHVGGGLAS